MALRAKCPECGHIATFSPDEVGGKHYCPRCDARLPRPTSGGPPALLIVGLVAGLLFVLCLVPAGLLIAWLGFRDQPAGGPVAGPVAGPPVVAERAPPVAMAGPAVPAPAPAPVADLPADGSLPPVLLEKLKAATVFVRVPSARGVSSGSGFVLRRDGDDAYLVTNQHVVADPAAGPGRSTVRTCQVVFHSGRRTEFTLPADVLAAEDSRDLAVLRVRGVGRRPGFPDALENTPGQPRETLPVFILGFPFGGMLATNTDNPSVTIGKGTVSSLREDDLGETSIVQIDGDINPGNSGGPVVDRQGRLIGITVAKIKGSNIGLAIPTDHLARMLHGRLSALGVEERPAAGGGRVDVQVRLAFIDPFNQVRGAGVIVAPAEAAGPRSRPAQGGYTAIAGRRHPIAVADQTGTVTIPLSGAGTQRFILQPVYTNGERAEIHAQPITRDINFNPQARPAPRPPSRPPVGPGAPTPPGPRSPARPPEVARPAEPWKPSGQDRPIGEVRTKEVQFAGKKTGGPGRRVTHTPPCLCWSADAKSFFALDNGADVVRRYSFPDLKEEAVLEIGKECSWLSPCKDGLLVTVPGLQEAWVLDETTLKKVRGFAIHKARQVVSARSSSFAFAAPDDGTVTVHDQKSGRVTGERQAAGASPEVGTLAMAPDGKRLYCCGGGTIHAFDVDGDQIQLSDKSPWLVSGRFVAMCLSTDGKYVCAPSGGGNHRQDGFDQSYYTTFLFRTSDLSKPILQIKTGAYPLAVGFDMKAGLVYAQNHQDQLIVLNDAGAKQKALRLEKEGEGRSDILQFLVHPDGRKLVVLAENSGVTGAKAIAVELPVGK